MFPLCSSNIPYLLSRSVCTSRASRTHVPFAINGQFLPNINPVFVLEWPLLKAADTVYFHAFEVFSSWRYFSLALMVKDMIYLFGNWVNIGSKKCMWPTLHQPMKAWNVYITGIPARRDAMSNFTQMDYSRAVSDDTFMTMMAFAKDYLVVCHHILDAMIFHQWRFHSDSSISWFS